ncbi:MAG: hypothetical protein R2705_02075 [Ilumatobacteraceae bacterium]
MLLGTAGGADGTIANSTTITGIGHDLTQQSTGYDYAAVVPVSSASMDTRVYLGHDGGASCGTAVNSIIAPPGSDVTTAS